jgi:hypothetical protein
MVAIRGRATSTETAMEQQNVFSMKIGVCTYSHTWREYFDSRAFVFTPYPL